MALIPATLLLAGCARSLFACRSALVDRREELLTYAAIALGLMLLIGADSYIRFPTVPVDDGHMRYLLPLLGAVFALAARAGGRRWGPVLGGCAIVLLCSHELFSQLQTIARYYG